MLPGVNIAIVNFKIFINIEGGKLTKRDRRDIKRVIEEELTGSKTGRRNKAAITGFYLRVNRLIT